MRSTFVVDANVILRYLIADHDEHFVRAKELMDQVREGDAHAFIGEGVLVECVFVMLKVYGVPRAEVANKLLGILAYRGIVATDRQVLIDALRLFQAHNVDIVDALVVATAQRQGWQPFSFDDDIRKLTRAG